MKNPETVIEGRSKRNTNNENPMKSEQLIQHSINARAV
jgi:hypothetical protein